MKVIYNGDPDLRDSIPLNLRYNKIFASKIAKALLKIQEELCYEIEDDDYLRFTEEDIKKPIEILVAIKTDLAWYTSSYNYKLPEDWIPRKL